MLWDRGIMAEQLGALTPIQLMLDLGWV